MSLQVVSNDSKIELAVSKSAKLYLSLPSSIYVIVSLLNMRSLIVKLADIEQDMPINLKRLIFNWIRNDLVNN